MFQLEKILMPACISKEGKLYKCNNLFKKTYNVAAENFFGLLSSKDRNKFLNFLNGSKKSVLISLRSENSFLKIKASKFYKINGEGYIIIFEKSEERKSLCKSIYEKSMDGILIESLDRTIIDANKALLKMTGYKKREVIGRKIYDFVEKDSLVRLGNKPKRGVFKVNIIKKNGDIIPIEVRSWIDELKSEKIAIAILRDVSDYNRMIEELNNLRKKLEREVKSQRILIRALSRLGVGIAIFQDYKGVVGVFREVNEYFLRILGLKREKIVNKKSFTEFISEESLDKFVVNYQKRIKGEKAEHLYEIVAIDKKGKKHYLLSNIEKINYKGKPAIFGFYFDITEKKEKEKILYEKEKQIAHIANNFNGFLWEATLSPEGEFVNNILTKGVKKITGYTSEELLAHKDKFHEIIYREDLPLVKKAILKLKKGKKVSLEFRIIDKKGEIKWLQGSGEAIKGKDGGFTFTGFAIDITKRKEFETKLRNLNLAIQASNEIFIIIDLEGKIQYANPAFEKKTGFTAKEVKGKPVSNYYKIIIPKSENLSEATIEGGRWRGVLYRKTKNGDFFRVFSSFSPILNSNNKEIGYFIVERDLSEEDLLIDKLNKILDSLSDLGFSFLFLHKKGENRGLIKHANKEFFDLTGFSRDEIIEKKKFEDIVKDYEKLEFSRSESIPRKARLYGKKKEYIVEYNFKDINFEGEDVIFVLMRDITERENLEEKLRRVQKYEAMGVLAGGIAHDFNNILSAIMGYIYLIKKEIKNKRILDRLDKIENTAKRASNLTRQLIGFARKGKYEKKPLDVREHVLNVIEILKASIDKRISINFKEEDIPVIIEGDPSQFEQVIMNILLNSIEAISGNGKIRISYGLLKADKKFVAKYPFVKEGEYVEIKIEDTGKGMNKKVLERIFEPFFTTKEKGNGLGLSNVYGIVRNHGGFILVDSEEGVGTTFKVYFPGKISDLRNLKGSGQLKKEIKKRNFKNKKILVVEDEAIIREMLEEMLSGNGFKVSPAKDGLDAIEKIKKDNSIELVILDMNMPRMNGKDAFFEIKKINPGVKILIATGYTYDSDVRMLLDEGASGFIQKPFKCDELIVTIEKLLNS